MQVTVKNKDKTLLDSECSTAVVLTHDDSGICSSLMNGSLAAGVVMSADAVVRGLEDVLEKVKADKPEEKELELLAKLLRASIGLRSASAELLGVNVGNAVNFGKEMLN